MSDAVHLIIKGKVQGVYFRASAMEVANKLGVKGWVKNMPNGNVEIMAKGSEEALEKFIAWCHSGPKHAAVEEVLKTIIKNEEIFTGFSIKK